MHFPIHIFFCADASNVTSAEPLRYPLPPFCRLHPRLRLSEDYDPTEAPFIGEDGRGRRKKVPIFSSYIVPVRKQLK